MAAMRRGRHVLHGKSSQWLLSRKKKRNAGRHTSSRSSNQRIDIVEDVLHLVLCFERMGVAEQSSRSCCCQRPRSEPHGC